MISELKLSTRFQHAAVGAAEMGALHPQPPPGTVHPGPIPRLTKPGVSRDDAVPRAQCHHARADLQHAPNAFTACHGWQRGQEGIGACREQGESHAQSQDRD